MLQKNTKIKTGFTLIELLIYMTISGIVLMAVIIMGQNLIESNLKTQGYTDVTANARIVMNIMTQKIRGSSNVTTASSVFNTNPGSLTLDYPGTGTDVIFDTYTKTISTTSGNITIRKIRMKDGSASYQDLTNDNTNVTNFVLKNLTKASETKNINIELTLQQVNPANNPNLNNSISVETAVSLRQ